MQLITTRALVLREVKFKDADKLLTLLTEDEGKLSVKARGALRKGCRYGAATEPLVYSEFTLFGNRGRWTLNEAETQEQFLQLREDMESLSLGTYFAELLEATSDEDSPNPELLRLGLNGLFALSRGLFDKMLIKAAFELRLMCLSGYEPDTEACPICGEADIKQPVFDLNEGNIHCRSCGAEDISETAALCADSLRAMRYIINSSPKRVFSYSLRENGARDRLREACERYTACKLERGFGALEYFYIFSAKKV